MEIIQEVRNPIKVLRARYKLTQEELAERIERERQVVIQVENGMYTQVPPAILEYFSEGDSSAKSMIQLDYLSWIVEERGRNSATVKLAQPNRSFEEYTIAVGGSQYGFCRAVVLQRSIVQGYYRDGYRWADIALALRQCGVEDETITKLHDLPKKV